MWRSCSDAWPALGLVQGLEEGLGTGLGPGRTLPGGSQVVTVDVRNKKAVFKDGFKLEYSKLLLAPGSSPKTLSCKGKEVENVFTIRTPEDANRVVRLARGRNAVVVGAGFLGMEVAAYLTEKAHSVSVVELEETPFRRLLGERVGRALMKMFENNRVKFYMQTEVLELRAQEGKLKEVVLKSSKVVRADVCVVGIGEWGQVGHLPRTLRNDLGPVLSSPQAAFTSVNWGPKLFPLRRVAGDDGMSCSWAWHGGHSW
uniref:AIF family member 3 n=1 Tax=Sus scrofa TaxID=9823 RepID=A0A8D1ZDQ7_PIG